MEGEQQRSQSHEEAPKPPAANGTPLSKQKSGSTAAAAAEGGGSGTKRRAGSYTTMHPNDPEAASKELLEKLSLYITQLGGSLGEGWKCDVKIVTVAENGETGTCNAAYLTPAGKRLRTRAEVAKFLGLDMPAAKGARHAGAGANSAAAGGLGKGQHAANDSPAGAAAAAGSADADDSGMTKAEAYAAAVARAKKLKEEGITLPLQLKNGVIVEELGVVDPRPTFCTPLSLMTPGYRAVFRDPAAGSFLSEIKAPPGAKHPQFVVSLVPDPQQLAHILEQGTQTGRTSLPGLADQQQATEQQQQQTAGAAAADGSCKSFELASARNADIAWAQVIGLQERARMQVDAAAAAAASGAAGGSIGGLTPAAAAARESDSGAGHAGPHTDAALDPVLAQLLVKAASLKGCWGKAMFGLADADVLQLIEALPGADTTPNYQFVDERGGWEKEREFLAKGRWAKRSALQIGVKKVPSRKPTPQPQQQSSAAAARAALSAAAPGSEPAAGGNSRKRPHPAAAAAAAAAASAGSESMLFGPAASKRYRAMGREERQVAGAVDTVLDKMIRKLEVWWVNETAREAKKAEKAEARAAAQAARKAAKAAEAAAAGQDAAADKQKAAAPSPAPLQEDLQLPGATSNAAPAAAPILNVLKGKQAHQLLQVWEFACCFGPLLGLGEVPSLQQLEAGLLGLVSHTGTTASSMLQQLAEQADPAAAEGSAEQQQQSASSLAAAAAAAGLHPSELSAAAAANGEQFAADAAAGSSWVQVHVAILRLLVEEIFDAVSGAVFDTENMRAAQRKDLRAATPCVDITTWPEAARRYLSAAATATYLAQGEPKSSATGSSAKELDLPGHLRCMEVQDWAQYLCGGLNMPDLVSRVALLPQGSSETAAESLMLLDDASALATAEQLVQQLAKSQQGTAAVAVDVDGPNSAAGPQQPAADQQLLGRRLLQALVRVWGDKSKVNCGTRMCFYAQELNAKLGRARGLDLHSVAARLEQGLYQATQDPMQALAADVVLACDLWRDAFNTFDMSHEEGFRSADSRLADAVEERLQQLLKDIEAGSSLAAAAGLREAGQQQQQQLEGAAAAPAPDGPAGQQNTAAATAEEPLPPAAATITDGDAAEAMNVYQHPQQQQHALAVAQADSTPPAPKQQAQQQQQQPAAANEPAEPAAKEQDSMPHFSSPSPSPEPQAEDINDPHGLKDPRRPFNPLAGCRVCWKDEDKAKLLLCDGCNDEYHCYCVTPALLDVPEGDWYCPVCSSSSSHSVDDASAGGTTAAAVAVAAAPAAGQNAGSSSSWDMAASAQLPVVTGSTSPAWARPGMQYIKELVGTAQKLGSVPYGSWPIAARLDLLVLLCELLAASNTGRRFVEERMEAKREAKRRMAESRAKINKAKKEAAEAAKAAAKEARAAKKAGATGPSGSGAAGEAPGRGEGAAEESTDAAAGKPPLSSAGSKAKGKKAAAGGKATRAHGLAEELFDEEAELRSIAMQQQLMELATVRRLYLGQDRFRNTYWLLGTSQLPVAADPTPGSGAAVGDSAAAAADTTAAAAAAGSSKPPSGLKQQQQQRGHGSSSTGNVGTYGVVFVQPAQPDDGVAAAAAAVAKSDCKAVAAAAAAFDKGPLRQVHQSAANNSSSHQQQQPLFVALQQQPLASAGAAAAAAAAAEAPWGVYRTLAELDALLAWLNPQGSREAALRSSLLKVRDNMVLFSPVAAVAAAGAAAEHMQQQDQGQPRSSRAGSPAAAAGGANSGAVAAAAEPRHPKLVLKYKMHQQHASLDDSSAEAATALHGNSSSSSTVKAVLSPASAVQLQQQLQVAASVEDDAAASEALRMRLQNFIASIPDISMHEFWGSQERRDAWNAAVAAASTPRDFAAVIALLDLMLLTDSWRMGWQLWSLPAQHPGLVTTWPQVWYRFLGLEASRKPGLPTRAQRDRAQELMWRAQAAGRTGGGAQQQQQQRKRQRLEVDFAEEDQWDEDEQQQQHMGSKRPSASVSLYTSRRSALSASAAGGSRVRGRQQQQQQQQEQDFLYVRSGRAAAAKAAAAITEQSKGLASTPAGRRRGSYVDDEFDYEDDYVSSESQQEDDQEDRDAALAAALAAEEGHHYPRRAAAVAATVAMASASGHHELLHPGHKRLTRGSSRQQQQQKGGGSGKQQQKKAAAAAGKKGKAKKPTGKAKRGRLHHKKSESESDSELEGFPSDSDEVHSEIEDAVSESDHEDQREAFHDSDADGVGQQSDGGDKQPAAGDGDEGRSQGSSQQQQQAAQHEQQQPAAVVKPSKQQKRCAADAVAGSAAALAGDVHSTAGNEQQRPAKKQKSDGEAEQQQQHQQGAVQTVAVPAAAAAAALPGEAGAAKPKPKITLKTSLKPMKPVSKTEALSSLLGGAALAPLSGKAPQASGAKLGTASAAAAKPTTAAAAGAARPSAAAAVPPLQVPGAGGLTRTGSDAAGVAAGKALLSPKKMMLERHEKETQQQGHVHTHLTGSAAAAAGHGHHQRGAQHAAGRGGAQGSVHGTKAQQADAADPKLASKQKMALDDEDDD